MSITTAPQVTLDGTGLTGIGHLDITIAIRATIEVDAATARRKVTGWLVSQVGNLLMGDTHRWSSPTASSGVCLCC